MKKKWITTLSAFACAVLGAVCLTACEEGGTGNGDGEQGYTVTFYVDGVAYQTLTSNGGQVVLPSIEPEKEGYIFDGWDYDSTQALTGDMEITAKWRPNPETPYMVHYYVKSAQWGNYELVNFDHCFGETGSSVTAQPLDNPYYIFREDLSTPSGVILADGNLHLQMYYDRVMHTVTFEANGGTLVSGEAEQQVAHGGRVQVPEFAKEGYSCVIDQSVYDMEIESDVTITVDWTINQYTIYYYGNNARQKWFTADYGTPIPAVEDPVRMGYRFTGWDREIPATMPAENIEIYAQYDMLHGMEVFDFYGWDEGCTVYGVLDTTVTSIVVPDCVTEIEKGAFENCTALESMTIPFVGLTRESTSEEGHFGAIFGGVKSTYRGESGKYHYYAGSEAYTYHIPTTLKQVTLTGELKSCAFQTCKTLETVVLSSALTSIKDHVFTDCVNLKKVNIPDCVETIEYEAFDGCTKLWDVTLPSDLQSIGMSAFAECSSLPSVTFGDKLTFIGSSAFEGCTSLLKVHIPDSVERLSFRAFFDCENITEVYLGNGIKQLGSSVFGFCNVEKLTLPTTEFTTEYNDKREYHIGYLFGADYASDNYSNCITLKEVEVYEGDYIYNQTFLGCSALEKVVLPNGVTWIGNSAFERCRSLKEFVIPSGLQTLGANAFKDCTNLPNVKIPLGVTEIGNSAFEGCASMTEFTVHETMKKIGEYAFKDCVGLERLYWGNSVESVGAGAFENCTALETVRVGKIDDWFTVYFGNENANPLNGTAQLYEGADLITKLVVPSTVTKIKAHAFYNWTQLNKVVVPDHVTEIACGAFRNCSGLQEMTIPFVGTSADAMGYNSVFGAIFGFLERNSYTDYNDGTIYQYHGGYNEYFHYYIPTSLKKVSLIGADKTPQNAFINMKIEEIVLGDGIKTLGTSTFQNCVNLKEISLPDGVERLGVSAFNGCTSLQKLRVPDSLEKIESIVFANCKALTFTTSGGVNYLGNETNKYVLAFSLAELKEDVEIEETTKFIVENAFQDTDIKSVSIPASVKVIGNNAFSRCNYLAKVTIAEGLQTIEYGAFNDCYDLEEIDLPTSVTYIGDSAFENSGLKSFTVPSGVTHIYYSTFESCGSLESVLLHDGVVYIEKSAFDSTRIKYVEYENGYYLSTATNPYYALVGYVSGITELTMHEDTEIMVNYLFDSDETIQTVTLGGSLEKVSDHAFTRCTSLTHVVIPDGVKIIGSSFSQCTSIVSVVIGKDVTVIEDYAFYQARGLTTVYYRGTAEDWEKIEIGGWKDTLEAATKYYYSEEQPTEEGNYWHYGDDGKTIEVWA